MKFFHFPLLLFICLACSVQAQNELTIEGVVKEAGSGNTLPGASVYLEPGLKGTVTDADGKFKFKAEQGKYTLNVSFIGYEKFQMPIKLKNENLSLEIELNIVTLETVEVEATRNENVGEVQMGVEKLEMETIEVLPAFLGEVDLLKTLQLLPGVQSAGEGNSGFYVRGGGPDQNLILLDKTPVYNASHLLGFFSVFNSDAVDEVTLIKGGMPAQYGERLAAVIDVKQRKGSKEEFKGKGGIGLISSRLTLEGPISKGKSSFIVSGRRTYVDVLARPFIPEDSEFGGSEYYFYDLNGRVDWDLGKNSRIYLSGYLGDDAFDFNSPESEFKTRIQWGNRLLSGGYQKLWKNTVLDINAGFTQYKFNFIGQQDEFELEVNSDITDYRLHPELTFDWKNHLVKVGATYIFHDISPNNSRAEQGETNFDLGEQQQFYSHEGAIYINDEFNITDDLAVQAGLRFSFFSHVGPFTRYIVDERGANLDTISYASGEQIKTYTGWEPRIIARYRLNEKSSVKASFTQNYQYIHLANLSPLALPTDVWLPSTDIVRPQLGRQYSAGYFRSFFNGNLETSVEVYYKDMENLVEYQENTQPSDGVGNNEDNLLTFGDGISYGVELFIKKTLGKTTGWIGYTWSKAEREFDDLNNGNTFFATFDRRHDISVVFIHQFNEKWSVSSNFIFGSGRAITLPEQGYFVENRLVYDYGARNSYRMRDYHRMDLSATLSVGPIRKTQDPVTGEIIEKRKRVQTKWVFSIYNVYNRLNPYFYYFDNEGRVADNTFNISAKQVSLFPILPSVTWNFSF